MKRVEFMERLEYLLQDIPDKDKAEALQYYRDYLEDAGEENEEQAIGEFGSPERVAAIIRSDLNGSLEEGGDFTEAGYRDERFRDPNFQVAKRMDLPEEPQPRREAEGRDSRDGQSGDNRGSRVWEQAKAQAEAGMEKIRRDSWGIRILKAGAILVLLCIAVPLVMGVGGGLFGLLAGLIALAVGVVVCVGVLTIAAWLAAAALLVMGVIQLFVSSGTGVLILGFGLLAIGFGLIGVGLSVWVYGRLIPCCVRGAVNWVSALFRGKEKKGGHS